MILLYHTTIIFLVLWTIYRSNHVMWTHCSAQWWSYHNSCGNNSGFCYFWGSPFNYHCWKLTATNKSVVNNSHYCSMLDILTTTATTQPSVKVCHHTSFATLESYTILLQQIVAAKSERLADLYHVKCEFHSYYELLHHPFSAGMCLLSLPSSNLMTSKSLLLVRVLTCVK